MVRKLTLKSISLSEIVYDMIRSIFSIILRTDCNGSRVEVTKSVRNLLQSSRQAVMKAGAIVKVVEVMISNYIFIILKVETRGFSE